MLKPRRDILSTNAAYHGAFDYKELAKLQLNPDDVLDFSVNSNPYGPPDTVWPALTQTPLDRYPDRDCLALRAALAQHHHIDSQQIVVGNGTAELLQLIAFVFLERGNTVLLAHHTFGEYERVAQLMGARIVHWQPAPDTTPPHADMVILCNPNNPDGDWLATDLIHTWAAQAPQTLFVIDEAYANFRLPVQTLVGTSAENILCVRSMTKDYALAGLRLGYVTGPQHLIEAIQQVCPAWNVNALAQAAGVAVLKDPIWLQRSVLQLHHDKQYLLQSIHALGLQTTPSSTHYFLLSVEDASRFRQSLLQHRIMVRDCTSFGLPQHIRIATRQPDDNQRLIDALQQYMAH